MLVHNKHISWYVDKIKNNEHFSQGMYGDGEWFAILKEKVGGTVTIGTRYSYELCEELGNSLQFKSPNYLFSSPDTIKNPHWTGIGEKTIDHYLKQAHLDIEFYEKEEWDRAMKNYELRDFVTQLRKMNVVIIGNKYLRDLAFLKYDHFIEIGYPDCYADGTLDGAYHKAIAYGKSGIYLISAGLPAALLTQRLHGKIPNSWFLDLGSIWDVFVGIGGQRGFRDHLYKNKELLFDFLVKSLKDIVPLEEVESQYKTILKNLNEFYPGKYETN